jgi:hypothetical protein
MKFVSNTIVLNETENLFSLINQAVQALFQYEPKLSVLIDLVHVGCATPKDKYIIKPLEL